jgi:APA family basic amino acid/polyamine antiporter
MAKGGQNGLVRRLGVFSVIAIIVADMVGTGIFTTSGLVMGNLRDPVLMIGLWGVGGLIALSGAFCYAELSAAMPYAGGEYLFLSRLFHPILGFLSGWISFIVGFSAPVAAASIGMSEYLMGAFPVLSEVDLALDINSSVFFQKGIAILVVLVFTLVHLQGLKLGSKIHNVLTILKIFLIVGLILVGFLAGEGSFSHLSVNNAMQYDLSSFKSIGLSVLWITFAYTGWNAAAYIGSEVKNPGKNLPRSLLAGTGIVIVLYILLNLLFVYATPPENMEGVISIGTLTVNNLFGSSASRIFSFLIAVALFSTVSALIILGPRIYYAMAKQGHFFSFAARIHPKTKVPHHSVIVQGALAIVIIFSGTFDEILTYMGFALGLFPLLAVYGVFILRRKGLSKYKIPWYPVIPIFFILINIFILILGFAERPVESSIALGTVAVGVPLYYLFKATNSSSIK